MSVKSKLVKIIVPLCVVLVIGGIWVFKNAEDKADDPAATLPPVISEDRVQPLNDTDFLLKSDAIDLDALTAYGLPLIIDFGSDSCIPCKEMAPVLETMNAEMQGLAIIKFVDVWVNTSAANDFPVQVIPTQVIINADGTPYVPSESMEESGIKFSMYTYKDTGEHAFTTHQGGMTEEQMRAILTDMGVASE
ncbi:MAG: thioredoxin [Clostridia bacterium]|nr:thioredoxin [Clostridia bacterium]